MEGAAASMPPPKYGYFEQPQSGRILTLFDDVVICSHSSVDRAYTLHADVVYVDPLGTKHRVPKGYQFNGLSVPRFFWRVCSPDAPAAFAASCLHDWLYQGQLVARSRADWIFYCASRARGYPAIFAYRNWLAVRMFGWWPWWRRKT